MQSQLQHRLPVVALPGVGLPHPLGNDLHVRLNEDGLDIGLEVPCLHPLQQGGGGSLGVDHPVAGLGPGVLPLDPLHRVTHLLQGQISDGVDSHVHSPAVGRPDQLIQLLLRVDGNAVVVRLVHITGDHLR